ncbi:transmembrane protein 53-B-like [Carettochelys insculpta]|uniref:transmembrane protein 53-B-like n=1 Tax=Carettochelys insculpta TaxID=44489 RepID=UPI003EB7B4A5
MQMEQAGGPEPPPLGARQPAGPARTPGRAGTTTVFSETIRLHSSPTSPRAGDGPPSRPLVVLLPWLGARPCPIARYVELYLPRGLDVLVVESKLGHFLWPRWGLSYAGQVLGVLQADRLCRCRPLLVHAISIGGYTFAQMLVHLSREPQQHRQLAERIRGLVYDSLVAGSVEHMVLGVAQLSGSRAWRPLIARGTALYFHLCRSCTVRYYEAAQRAFFRPLLRCPVLVFYCCNDPLSDPARLHELLASWRGAGLQVQAQGWQDSCHAAHLRQHPQQYQATLQGFLRQLDMALLHARL